MLWYQLFNMVYPDKVYSCNIFQNIPFFSFTVPVSHVQPEKKSAAQRKVKWGPHYESVGKVGGAQGASLSGQGLLQAPRRQALPGRPPGWEGGTDTPVSSIRLPYSLPALPSTGRICWSHFSEEPGKSDRGHPVIKAEQGQDGGWSSEQTHRRHGTAFIDCRPWCSDTLIWLPCSSLLEFCKDSWLHRT